MFSVRVNNSTLQTCFLNVTRSNGLEFCHIFLFDKYIRLIIMIFFSCSLGVSFSLKEVWGQKHAKLMLVCTWKFWLCFLLPWMLTVVLVYMQVLSRVQTRYVWGSWCRPEIEGEQEEIKNGFGHGQYQPWLGAGMCRDLLPLIYMKIAGFEKIPENMELIIQNSQSRKYWDLSKGTGKSWNDRYEPWNVTKWLRWWLTLVTTEVHTPSRKFWI